MDFYHLDEYFPEAAAGAFDEVEAKRWRDRQKKDLKAGRFKKVVAALEAIAEPEGTPEERAPVCVALHYYLDNRQGASNIKRKLMRGCRLDRDSSDLPIATFSSAGSNGREPLGLQKTPTESPSFASCG